jgi:hypothetical protein
MSSQVPTQLKEEADAERPSEVGIIISALQAGGSERERRDNERWSYPVQGYLRLFVDTPQTEKRLLYVRDANHRGVGFVTRCRLPLGYGGFVELPNPEDPTQNLQIHCTLVRCRLAAPGWYEGALHFHRDQHEFMGLANKRVCSQGQEP